jgi:hypothetical protein
MGNNCFVVIAPGEDDRIFFLEKGSKELLIGRRKSAGLHLQHITVSREHALLHIDSLLIQNRSSKEDTMLINGKVINETTIKSLDRVQIGIFQLIFYGQDLSEEQRLYNGISLSKIPEFSSKGSQRKGATLVMDEDKMQEIQRVTEILRKAHIISNKNTDKMWLLTDRTWTIGKGADIPVGGWFTGSRLAEVEWTGKYHHIIKKGMSSVVISRDSESISVDKTGVELKDQDKITIGNDHFTYVMKQV